MYKIVLIGAGQLGSRHLQGLLNINLPVSIEVVDPSQDSLDLARHRAGEMAVNSNIKEVLYKSSINDLSSEIDIAIIASTSNTRFTIIEKLISITKVKNLVLEKILFQREEEYELTKKILSENTINCWVNCPRRLFPVYQSIKKLIKTNERLTYTVLGGEWGLACNAIHFIDHLNFLNGEEDFAFDVSGVSDVFESKRKGFYELAGSLKATQPNGSELFLHSRKGSTAGIKIQILSDSYFWQIDELKGQLITSSRENNEVPIVSGFNTPYQSQLTDLICESILLKNEVNLTRYSVSSKLHLQMLNAFSKVFSTNSVGIEDGCPIT
jgi:hypothetical protein